MLTVTAKLSFSLPLKHHCSLMPSPRVPSLNKKHSEQLKEENLETIRCTEHQANSKVSRSEASLLKPESNPFMLSPDSLHEGLLQTHPIWTPRAFN